MKIHNNFVRNDKIFKDFFDTHLVKYLIFLTVYNE
jgi:hypothetical protein